MSCVELTDDDFDADDHDNTDEDGDIDDEVFIKEEDEILCCDFIVLSVRLLKSPPWHTVFNASLKVFHLLIMMVVNFDLNFSLTLKLRISLDRWS